MAEVAFELWDQLQMDLFACLCVSQYHHYYTLDNPLPLGSLDDECFNHAWIYKVSFGFPLPILVTLVLSKFLAEHFTVQFRLLILMAPLLDGDSLASHRSQHVLRHSSLVSCHKGSCPGCFSRLGAQGSAFATLNHLSAQRCMLCGHRFSSSVCQAVAGVT